MAWFHAIYDNASSGVATGGTLAVAGLTSSGDITLGSGAQLFLPNGTASDPAIAFTSDPDSGLYYSSQVIGTFGGSARIGWSTLVQPYSTTAFTAPVTTTSYIQFTETAAPAGLTNAARLYAVEDGGGKTDLAVVFQTGAAQTAAQEP